MNKQSLRTVKNVDQRWSRRSSFVVLVEVAGT